MDADLMDLEMDWPRSLIELKEVIGTNGVVRLVEGFGGVRVFIPKQLRDGHRLVANLGQEVAGRLSRHFGGETLSIPRAVRTLRRMRNREIVEQYNAGIPVRRLAMTFRLTERQIYTILGAS